MNRQQAEAALKATQLEKIYRLQVITDSLIIDGQRDIIKNMREDRDNWREFAESNVYLLKQKDQLITRQDKEIKRLTRWGPALVLTAFVIGISL